LIKIRPFEMDDISYKVKWINEPRNNKYLHYDTPINYSKTLEWFEKVKKLTSRLDLTIIYNDKPVGLIGLLNIDFKNKKAEYYILIGELGYKGKGIAYEATRLLFQQAIELGLRRIYLFTEIENNNAQKLFSKLGFKKEGLLKNDLYYKDRFIDRYLFAYDLFSLEKKGTVL